MKPDKNYKKYMKNHIFPGINVIIILTLIIFVAGCTDQEPKPDDFTGTYTKDDKTTLQIYENGTFFFKLRVGYLMGREINQTVGGTYHIEEDRVVFLGDGVETVGYIQGDSLIIEGSKYTRQNLGSGTDT